ncbi:hypothetical protein QPK87_35030 [Kamptonema cortianum]|nr:hypothetical protein [Kamptonema cortianum]
MRHSLIAAALTGAALIILYMVSGWRPGSLPFQPFARFSDAATSHYPAAQYFSDSINERGEFPVWRQTIMAGQPFAANPLNKTAYPLTWLAVALPMLAYFDVMIALHLVLAGAGMFCWARALGLRVEAAAFCAAAYLVAPRMIAHLAAGHLDLIYALAWFPWLMFSVVRAARQPALRHMIVCGIAAGLVVLADVRLAFYALLFALVIFLAGVRGTPIRRVVPGAAAAVILLILLTASVTLPLAGWSPYLTRAALTAQDAGVFSIDFSGFLGLLLAPRGNPETLTYMGVGVLLLAVFAAVAQPRRHIVLLAVVLIAAIWGMGPNGGVWSLVVEVFPALRWFRVPSRALLIVTPIVIILAGYGLQLLLDGVKIPPRHARRVRLILFTITAICGALGAAMLVSGQFTDSSAAVLLVSGTCVGLCLFLWLNLRRSSRILIALILLAAAVDQLAFARRWLEWRGIDEWFMPHAALAQRLLQLEPDRIYSPTYSVPQFVAEFDYFQLFGGVDPFQIAAVSEAIRAASRVEAPGYSVVMPPLTGMRGDRLETANQGIIPDAALLARWGVSHVVAAYEIPSPDLRLIAGVDGQFIYANRQYSPDWPRDALTGWPTEWEGLPVSETVSRLNDLTLTATLVSQVVFVSVSLLLAIGALRSRWKGSSYV